MNSLVDFLKLILIVCIFSGLVYIIDDWIVHISLIKENVDIYGFGNFKLFKKYFNKTKWEHEYSFKWSLFYEDRINNIESKIHANVFVFNNIGMIIRNPINFWMTKIYIYNFIKTNFLKDEKRIRKEKIYKWK